MTQMLTGAEASLSRAEQAALVLGRWAEAASPGAHLGTKKELRERIGVSKGTFNEAVRLLESRGLVSTRTGPGGGLFSVAPSPLARLGNSLLRLDADASDVGYAVRIRDALDPLLIEDALEHSSAADIARMRRSLEEMETTMETGDYLDFLRANWSLHEAIARVTPNKPLRSIYVSLLDMIRSHTVAVESDKTRPLACYIRDRYKLHSNLVDALDRRDREAVKRLAAEHSIQGPFQD
ncbi:MULTISPECIES: FadR/GntR family transcriptional regulator [Micrococcaceae]|uniref:FadR/GntR family transcriptional regulator n=1 Tax=unclassified Kocuria TaxID=2649579 RepID=UPI001013640B|nr:MULTISPECIES: FCD domain-containing protein [unclassified Kocuria]